MPHKFAADQLALIKDLGPYAKHAKSNHTYTEFEARVFNLWSICWPLKAKDFDDQDFLEAYWTIVKRQHIRHQLQWAAFSSTPKKEWEIYLSVCEARCGIAKDTSLNGGPSRPRPRPHPITKKSTVQQPSLPTEDKP
ncbi:unnamed protein product [Cyclocybe aegerita]|uniref:Uncharacterized protein n=1 Tax=Cyclocybe aegerita TaxID=1973307 RepID=A0A8S0W0V9_CYCAE|nr:unnamed protein product [Cyclocybe aegerita]